MSFFLNLRLTLKIDFKKFACFVFVFPFCCCFYFVCSNSSSVCDRAKLKERALSQPPSPLSLSFPLPFSCATFWGFFRAFFFCFFDNIAYYAYSACQLVLSVDFFPAAAAAISLVFVCLCVCCALLSQFVFLLLICRRRDDFCSLIRVAGLVRSRLTFVDFAFLLTEGTKRKKNETKKPTKFDEMQRENNKKGKIIGPI